MTDADKAFAMQMVAKALREASGIRYTPSEAEVAGEYTTRLATAIATASTGELGHEKLEATAIHTEVSIAQLKAIHARSHPAEERKRIDPGGDSSTG